jgi:PST family polysaccharide transporter
MVAAVALAIWLARYWIVRWIFTDAFLPMADLFWLQLIGDVVKIAAWTFAYFLVAKGMALAYVATEIVFSASFYLLAAVLIGKLGLLGVPAAYALNYLAYLATLVIIVAFHLRAMARSPSVS